MKLFTQSPCRLYRMSIYNYSIMIRHQRSLRILSLYVRATRANTLFRHSSRHFCLLMSTNKPNMLMMLFFSSKRLSRGLMSYSIYLLISILFIFGPIQENSFCRRSSSRKLQNISKMFQAMTRSSWILKSLLLFSFNTLVVFSILSSISCLMIILIFVYK